MVSMTGSPKHDLGQASEFPEYPINGDGAQQIQGRPPRNLNAHNSDIVWSGSSWTCGKQLKHYPAFRRNGTKIAIQSFVFVMAKEENQYVAYLEDMYEDKRGQKKVKVRWFHHTQEVKGVVHLRNSHPKEVFITPYSQVISAECVDGPATVLTREHYEECLAAFRDALSTKLHLCSRQFRSNKIKPFDVSKLRGYFEQPIFSFLYSKPSSGLGSISHGPIGEEEEELSLSENVKLGSKRTRGGRGFETFVTEHFGIEISGSQMITYDPSYRNVSCGFSGKHVEFYRWNSPLFKVDEKIELLCQDSGIRGCWFRCTVLQVSRKHIRVQYDDLQDEDQCSNLEEWIPAFKLAIPDKIGMRCFGRSTIRPAPPVHEQTDLDPKVGSAVDAWWSDGWWEGVVTGINNGSNDDLQVFCPGENFVLNVPKKVLRISKDWVGGQWIDIEAKPDVLAAISATMCPDPKMSMSLRAGKEMSSDVFDTSCTEVLPGATHDTVNELKPELVISNSSDGLVDDMDCDKDSRPPSSNDEANEDDGNVNNISHDKADKVQGDDACEVDGDAKNDAKRIDMELSETSEENCKAMKPMEVMA
uniref:BAH domain-containing protein n=1 Tax=Rhizophora mucronata TaxID=61149 RepID=A0A2P2JIY3_RHIMU